MDILGNKKTLEPLYTVNRESLFGLSRQEFRDNNFANSLSLNRMNSIFNQCNIDKPVGFYDFIGKILDYREWAAECNYVLHEVPLPMLHKTPDWLAFFPEIFQNAHKNYEYFYKQRVFLCEASECYGVKALFNLGLNYNNQIEHLYGFFSNRLSFLVEKALTKKNSSNIWKVGHISGISRMMAIMPYLIFHIVPMKYLRLMNPAYFWEVIEITDIGFRIFCQNTILLNSLSILKIYRLLSAS